MPGTAYILVDGDYALFDPTFTPAVVVCNSIPAPITGSGPATIAGAPMCIEPDFESVKLENVSYTAGMFSTPGLGTLTISQLAPGHVAQSTTTGGQPVLLESGEQFIATFTVDTKAFYIDPASGSKVEDVNPEYSGFGAFETTNTLFIGT